MTQGHTVTVGIGSVLSTFMSSMVEPLIATTLTASGVATTASAKVTETIVAAVTTKAADSLASKIENSVNRNWNGSARDAKRIEEMVKVRTVLGSPKGVQRDHYARSPILKYMKSNVHTTGTVYVAYVPPGLGKTTACHAYMHKKYRRRGMAFVPADLSLPYFESMIRLLELDPENPPDGLLNLIISTLSHPDPGILVLDDFMSQGINALDLNLLNNIKKWIRESGVTVIVLTANKDAANFLLSQNDLKFVCPLVKASVLKQIGDRYRPIIRDTQVQLDWSEYLSMKWDKTELKAAVMATTDYQLLDERRKADVERRFTEEFDMLSNDQREITGPVDMLRNILRDDQPIIPSDTLSPTIFSDVAAKGGSFCKCGDSCMIS